MNASMFLFILKTWKIYSNKSNFLFLTYSVIKFYVTLNINFFIINNRNNIYFEHNIVHI